MSAESLRPRRGVFPHSHGEQTHGHPRGHWHSNFIQRLLLKWRLKTSLTTNQTIIIILIIVVVITFYFTIDVSPIKDKYIGDTGQSISKSKLNEINKQKQNNNKDETIKSKSSNKNIYELIDHTQINEEPFGFINLTNIYETIITNNELNEKGFSQIVAIGDLHGDINQCRKILQKTKIIDKNDNWIAKKGTILIQTGDIFDRGHESVDVLKLFWKLRQMASSNDNNGLVLQILGNHEHMNLIGEYRYVNMNEFSQFGGESHWKHLLSLNHAIGWYLRQLPIIRIIGNTLFVHAGLRPEILEYFNNNISNINEIFYTSLNNFNFDERNFGNLFYDSLTISGNNGPIWTREFEPRFYDLKMVRNIMNNNKNSNQNKQEIIHNHMCEQVSKTLKKLNLKRMVIGHNVQQKGIVNNECNGKLFKIDVGMSYAYGSSLGAIIIDLKSDLVTII